MHADFSNNGDKNSVMPMKAHKILLGNILLLCMLSVSNKVWSDNVLSCVPTSNAPKIDGKADDRAWRIANQLTIKDAVVDLTHNLTCVYDCLLYTSPSPRDS